MPVGARYRGWYTDPTYKHLIAVVGPEGSLSTTTAANTATRGWSIGTPVVTAIPDHSLILSSTVDAADIVMLSTRASGDNSHEIFRVDSSAGLIVFNEGSSDWDFRIESDDNSNIFAIDAGANALSMGAAPSSNVFLDMTPGARSATTDAILGSGVRIATSTVTDNATAMSGTATNFAYVGIAAPTLAASNTSVTTSDAVSLYVSAAPIAGTNQTFSRSYSILCDAGNFRVDGNVQVGLDPTFGTTAPTRAIVFINGTAPAGTVTTGGALYTATATNVELSYIDSAGNVQQLSTT